MDETDAPTTPFELSFGPLRPYLGTAARWVVPDTQWGLRMGEHNLTIFDWATLDDDSRGMLAECQLFELASGEGRGWADKMRPVALVGGESHPVPLDELDQQTDGVLLIEVATGVLFLCPDASTRTPRRVALSAGEICVLGEGEE